MRLAKLSTKFPQTVRGVTSGDIGKDEDPEKRGSAAFSARGPKFRVSGNTASKKKWKHPGTRRDAGRLSRLPDMPLDVMYDVSYRIASIAGGGVYDNLMDLYRYSLLSPDGFTPNIVGQQGLSSHSHK